MRIFFFFLILINFISCQKEFKELMPEVKLSSDSEMPDNKLSFIQDSIPENIWNSGSTGTHWANFSFPEPREIKKFEFEVPIWPSCTMTYDIMVKKKGENTYQNVESKTQFTYNLQKFSFDKPLENITDIKLVISEDSSYPGLRHVSILGR